MESPQFTELTARMIYGVLLARLSMDLARMRARSVIALVVDSTRGLDTRGALGARLVQQVRSEAEASGSGWEGPQDQTVTRTGPLGISATSALAAMREAPGHGRELLVWRLVCGLLPDT